MIDRDHMLRKAHKTKEERHWSLYKKLRNSCNNKLRFAKCQELLSKGFTYSECGQSEEILEYD